MEPSHPTSFIVNFHANQLRSSPAGYTATALAKVHADIFWNMTCDDLQSWPGWSPLPEALILQMLEIAAREKKVMQRDGVPFSEARKAALGGWFGPLHADHSNKFPEWCQGAPGTPGHMNRIIRGLIDDFHAIPSIQVLAGIDAAMILSKRELNAHDMRDLMHAAVAVPNCDAFFCDKHIASLLTTSPLQFDEVYGTAILSRPGKIVDFLAAL